MHRSDPSFAANGFEWGAALAKIDDSIGRVSGPLSLDHDGDLMVDSLDDRLVGMVDEIAREVEALSISLDDEDVTADVRGRVDALVDVVDLAIVRTEPLRRLRQLGFAHFDVMMTLETLGVEISRTTLEVALFFDTSIGVIDELAMLGLVARRAALREERWRLSRLGSRVLDECRRQVDAVLQVCVSLIDAELADMTDGDLHLADGFAVGEIDPKGRAEDKVTVLWFSCLGAKAFQICETHRHSAWVKVAFGAEDAHFARYQACMTVAHLVGAQRPRYVEEMIEALRRLFSASTRRSGEPTPDAFVTSLMALCQRLLDELREGFGQDASAFEDARSGGEGAGAGVDRPERRIAEDERRRQVEQAKAELELELDASGLLKAA